MKKFKVKVYLDSPLRRSINAATQTAEFDANMDDSYTAQMVEDLVMNNHKGFKSKHPNDSTEILKIEVKEVKPKKGK